MRRKSVPRLVARCENDLPPVVVLRTRGTVSRASMRRVLKQEKEMALTCWVMDSEGSKVVPRLLAWSVGVGAVPRVAGHQKSSHAEKGGAEDKDFRLVRIEFEAAVLHPFGSGLHSFVEVGLGGVLGEGRMSQVSSAYEMMLR
ncbi:hypothetical protein NDU88_004891 [Pleurodeles waltl]|uniref:Uncharacterized protein n=1 Tax=Pleurodeles waltl TaxID=8319 RepID=A0AAV7M7M0_PLEWA|nr:hypothetical protein NDU88_004891 [Pleurodeles waltl]